MPPAVVGGRGEAFRLPYTRPTRLADTLALLLAAGTIAVFETLHHADFPVSGPRFLSALAITCGFAALAWLIGGVSLNGALAGSAVAFVMAIRDLRMFAALLTVFVVTLAATRIGNARKQALRAAEPPGGRSASQAMANLGTAALIVAIGPSGWPVLALAALAEAAADTGSSEIGMAFPGKTVLITTFQAIPPGTDGGVSLYGTLAALLGGAMVALVAALTRLVPVAEGLAIVMAGFAGAMFDSLLGAVLERRGQLNNDLVNLLSTAAAVGVAWLIR